MIEASCGLDNVNSVPLDIFVLCLLLQDIHQLEITRITANAVDNGVGEFALGDVFTKPFVLSIQVALQVLVVIADLEDDSEKVDERHAISVSRLVPIRAAKRGAYSVLWLSICISLIASRNSPPVLLATISRYSSSVGQVKESRQ